MACRCPWAGSFFLRVAGHGLPAGIIFVVEAERRGKAVGWIAADRFPADKVAIPASLWVDEKSENGMHAQGLEEIRRGAGGEAAGAAFRPLGLLRDVRENFKFLFLRRGGKARNAGKEFGGGLLRGLKAFLIDRQRVAEKSFQCAVDEVDHAGLARASGCIGRDDARAEGFNLARLVRGENFQRGMT